MFPVFFLMLFKARLDLFRLGGAGDPPAPLGDPPGGTEQTIETEG
jgi:hypothetical protein